MSDQTKHRIARYLLTIALLGCVVSIGLVVEKVVAEQRGGPIDLYFLDLNTNTLFSAKSDMVPPIEAPSDAEVNREAKEESEKRYSGVRAHVFSCTTCDDEDARFIGYLEKYTSEGKAAMEEVGKGGKEVDVEAIFALEDARLLKLPDAEDWIKGNSEEALDIYAAIRNRCAEDQRPRQCFPGR